MIHGIEVFSEYFEEFSEMYRVIGGSACSLVMDYVELDFRATKDIDIVLCCEL